LRLFELLLLLALCGKLALSLFSVLPLDTLPFVLGAFLGGSIRDGLFRRDASLMTARRTQIARRIERFPASLAHSRRSRRAFFQSHETDDCAGRQRAPAKQRHNDNPESSVRTRRR
jgi:hypothetical protein